MSFFLITNEGYNSLQTGINKLNNNENSIDVIESMINIVENDESVHSVGLSAWPNMLGEMEFDASIINGTSLEAGAVGALKNFYNPISVAKAVMEKIPHAFLVGDGARLFADEHKFGRHLSLNADAMKGYFDWMKANDLQNINTQSLSELAWETADPQKAGGTVVSLVCDNNKTLSAGVSTSGWAWKYPGRLGDSPVIGAGIYADSRYGAAGCIGHGEVAIRTTASKSIVQYMECGLSVEAAVTKVAHEIQRIPKKFKASISLHAVSANGEPYSISLGGGVDHYYFWSTGEEKAEKITANKFLDI